MLGHLSADMICSEKLTVFRERGSKKTVSLEEQIMFKDKYPSMLSKPYGGYCAYYPSNIFFAARAAMNIGNVYTPSPHPPPPTPSIPITPWTD